MKLFLPAAVFLTATMGAAMAQDRIRISSAWGAVTVELAENDAAKALSKMLPLTVEMTDHLRQEKTGNLPADLQEQQRQREFAVGTLGLWSSNHFVIYYRSGHVSLPGIVVLGQVTGDISILVRPRTVTVRMNARSEAAYHLCSWTCDTLRFSEQPNIASLSKLCHGGLPA